MYIKSKRILIVIYLLMLLSTYGLYQLIIQRFAYKSCDLTPKLYNFAIYTAKQLSFGTFPIFMLYMLWAAEYDYEYNDNYYIQLGIWGVFIECFTTFISMGPILLATHYFKHNYFVEIL